MDPIALAFSDLHLHRWKAFNKKDSRLDWTLTILDTIMQQARIKKVPILFTGDLIHNEKAIDNKILLKLGEKFGAGSNPFPSGIYSISGNHDMSEKNTFEHRSPSYITSMALLFPRFFYDMDFYAREVGELKLFGIPYINGNVGFKKILKGFIKQINPKKYNILMLHTDLPGATDAFGHVIDEVENIKLKYFKHFDLVLDGHIHKPQRVFKNTFILGSPYQQTRSEKGLDLGYWEIYKDRKPKKILLNLPQFIDVEEGDEVPDDGNFYTVIPKPREFVTGKKFDAKLDRVKLAKKYLNHTGIKNEEQRSALIKILNATQ